MKMKVHISKCVCDTAKQCFRGNFWHYTLVLEKKKDLQSVLQVSTLTNQKKRSKVSPKKQNEENNKNEQKLIKLKIPEKIKTKADSFKKINRIDKILVRLTKKKKIHRLTISGMK